MFEKIDRYVLSEKWDFYELEEKDHNGNLIKHGYRVAEDYAKKLGNKVAKLKNHDQITLIRRIISNKAGSSNIFLFSYGFAEALNDNRELLNMTVSLLLEFKNNERNFDFLCGQLKYLSKHDINLANEFLDYIIENKELHSSFVLLQLSYELDDLAIERIIKSLKENISPLWMYSNLASGRRHEPISDTKLCEIVDLIMTKENGEAISLKILGMRFHGLGQDNKYFPSRILINKSAIWLASMDYLKLKDTSGMNDHDLTQVANICFSDNKNEQYARVVLKSILNHCSHAEF